MCGIIKNAKRQQKRKLEKEKQRPKTTKIMFKQQHLQIVGTKTIKAEREDLCEQQELNRLNREHQKGQVCELDKRGRILKRKEPDQEEADEAEKPTQTQRLRQDQQFDGDKQLLKKLSEADLNTIAKTIENFF